MPKATVLNRLHRAAGARMVDFGGWDMPVSYGSQIDEHHAVRRAAGMFDVSHMRAVDVRGDPPAPRDLLRYALANNVDKLKVPGKALYSCLLRADGGVLDDLIAYFLREEWFRLVVNAATTDKDLAWLGALVRERAPAVSLVPRDDLAMIAVQGPQARAKTWAAIPESEAATVALAPFSAVAVATARFGELFVARTGYTGEDGFEITVPATHAEALWTALAEAGVVACGLGARDTLRLEAGMNLYGQDMDENVSPLESGLGWTVNLASAREFSGKAALAASKPARRLAGLVLRDAGGVLRAHQRVHTDMGDGEVTSGTWSPTLERSIALARLPSTVPVDAMVEVEIRGKRLAARVVKPPFVRHGVALVS